MNQVGVKTQIAEAAAVVERSLDCPAEVLFGQCALESNWLRSAPGNNCFGFEDYPGSFGRQTIKTFERATPHDAAMFLKSGAWVTGTIRPGTHEDSGTDEYSVQRWFATFPTLEACFVRRAKRWNSGRQLPWVQAFYGTVVHTDEDLMELFRNIASSGYATADPDKYAGACLERLNEPGSREAIQAARVRMNESKA